jgi:hypothetical protein
MEDFKKKWCNYYVVRDLLSDDKSDTKYCCWIVVIVIMILLLVAISVGVGHVLFCPCCCCMKGWIGICLTLFTIPVAMICLTYLATLLIKRMSDADKEKELRYRFAQFCLAELNREKKNDDVKHEASCDVEAWQECVEKVEIKIKESFKAVCEIIKKQLEKNTDK